jgi:hypothetical protein
MVRTPTSFRIPSEFATPVHGVSLEDNIMIFKEITLIVGACSLIK